MSSLGQRIREEGGIVKKKVRGGKKPHKEKSEMQME